MLLLKKLVNHTELLGLATNFRNPSNFNKYVPYSVFNKSFGKEFDSHIIIFGRNPPEDNFKFLPPELRNDLLLKIKEREENTEAPKTPFIFPQNLIFNTCDFSLMTQKSQNSARIATHKCLQLARKQKYQKPLIEYVHYNELEETPLAIYYGIVEAVSYSLEDLSPTLSCEATHTAQIKQFIKLQMRYHQFSFFIILILALFVSFWLLSKAEVFNFTINDGENAHSLFSSNIPAAEYAKITSVLNASTSTSSPPIPQPEPVLNIESEGNVNDYFDRPTTPSSSSIESSPLSESICENESVNSNNNKNMSEMINDVCEIPETKSKGWISSIVRFFS